MCPQPLLISCLKRKAAVLVRSVCSFAFGSKDNQQQRSGLLFTGQRDGGGGYVMETSVCAEPAGKVIRCRKGVGKCHVIDSI